MPYDKTTYLAKVINLEANQLVKKTSLKDYDIKNY